MATEQTIKNLVINKVESQEVFDFMMLNGIVSEDELYLIQGKDTSVLYTAQDLTEEQKRQALENIDAASNTEMQVIIQDIRASLSTNVVLTIFPVKEGIGAVLLHEDGETVLNGTSNENGVVIFNVRKLGRYAISFNNAYVSMKTPSIDITQYGELHYLTANYTPPSVYTVAIDINNSNPATCCSYENDASGMQPGSSAWDGVSIFNDIKPCIFRDGEVQYYLNKNDYRIKTDGTAANVTGLDGDVMIEIPQFGYRIYPRSEVVTVSTSEDGSVTLTESLTRLIVQVTNDASAFDEIPFIFNVTISAEVCTSGDDNAVDYYYIIDENGNKLRDPAGVYITTQYYTVDENGYLRDIVYPEFYVGTNMILYNDERAEVEIYHQDTDGTGAITQTYFNFTPPYRRYAFSKLEADGSITIADKIYLGAYLATYDDATLKTTLKSVVTSTEIISSANAYKVVVDTLPNLLPLVETSGYQIWGHQQIIALQCLYIIKYCNLNSQIALGNGYIGASSSTTRVVGATAIKGTWYGTIANKTESVKVAGLEDFYGHQNQWVADIGYDKAWNLVTDHGVLDGMIIPAIVTADTNILAKNVIGTTEGGFLLGSKTAGSATTYWCDKMGVYNGTYAIAEDGTVTGELYRWCHGGASNASTNGGVFFGIAQAPTAKCAVRLLYI